MWTGTKLLDQIAHIRQQVQVLVLLFHGFNLKNIQRPSHMWTGTKLLKLLTFGNGLGFWFCSSMVSSLGRFGFGSKIILWYIISCKKVFFLLKDVKSPPFAGGGGGGGGEVRPLMPVLSQNTVLQ